jgi:putative PIN family toxin of toxin-antitoxin system
MVSPRVVLDTNVLIAALRSRRGASSKLVSLLGTDQFRAYISVALALEYEDVVMRQRLELGLALDDVSDLIDSICAVSAQQLIYYSWRPTLVDAQDDLVLELAVAAQCDYIVTFNKRHFKGVERFGLKLATPREFLLLLEE